MSEFSDLVEKYIKKFGDHPPVNEWGQWPTPEDGLEMLKRSLARGTPLTEEDEPNLPDDGTVY